MAVGDLSSEVVYIYRISDVFVRTLPFGFGISDLRLRLHVRVWCKDASISSASRLELFSSIFILLPFRVGMS